jgi:hypothetical protein
MIRCILTVAYLWIISASHASIIFAGTSDLDRSASAHFTVLGGTMSIELSNTSTYDVANPLGILTGLFFDLKPAYAHATFVPQTAYLGAGSVVHFGPDGGGNVSGEWAFNDSLVGAPLDMRYGIGSAGFGLFGPTQLFPGGPVLTPPIEPDGLNYGITTAGDDANTGNMAVSGGTPLIQNSVLFNFAVSDGFDVMGIESVYFQYGTALYEGGFVVPSVGGLMFIIIACMSSGRRR